MSVPKRTYLHPVALLAGINAIFIVGSFEIGKERHPYELSHLPVTITMRNRALLLSIRW
jgi:hypothetical protein